MQTFALTTFLADAERRARTTGVADVPVDALRNKGAGRTANKRMLLARAAARMQDQPQAILSYA